MRERERERERQRHRQKEKQAPGMEPDVGLDPGSPGSRPGLKAAINRWATRAALEGIFNICTGLVQYLVLIFTFSVFIIDIH